MKLNERCNWEEEDLSQPQSERLLVIERKIYVTDWLAMAIAYLAGVFSLALVVIIFGGHR